MQKEPGKAQASPYIESRNTYGCNDRPIAPAPVLLSQTNDSENDLN